MSKDTCIYCQRAYDPRNTRQLTCGSNACRREHYRVLAERRNERLRQGAIHNRPPAPVLCACGEWCPGSTNGKRRWCNRCRRDRQTDYQRANKFKRERTCRVCGTAVPEAQGKPGITVCSEHRADKRKRSNAEHNRRRRFRLYGITQAMYDAQFAAQGGKCIGCHTKDPGGKGWCIDHCHDTGEFRFVLCSQCNGALGMVKDSEDTLIRLASALSAWRRAQLRLVS